MTKARPYLITDQDAAGEELHPLPWQDQTFDEVWLQELLYRHPSILPVDHLDEAFAPPIAIGRELANIDNLFVSPKGLLTLVETKLWRNPEAHRTVVAQILDYAYTLTTWDYSKLDEAIQAFMRKRHGEAKSIYRTVKGFAPNRDMSEIEFQEMVQNSLTNGKFALLMVGDRIFPGATQLAQTIQSAPHLQYSIGFIELQCYKLAKDSDWPLVVVPQVVLKTREVTRAVVKVLYEEKKPEVQIFTPTEEKTSARLTSYSEFLASLPSSIEETFKTHLDRWMQSGYTVYWGQVGFSLRIYWKGKLTTIFDAYPTYASILQEKRVKQFDLPREAYNKYRAALMGSPTIGSAFAAGKRYLYFERMSEDDVVLLLSSTDELVQSILSTDNPSLDPDAKNP